MEPETTILEEDIDENYEPTQEGNLHTEIEEYATYIGLDLDEDQDLLYIAREGLKAPLPPPWKPCQEKGKEIFYFNFETQESVWEHPCDKFYKEKARELKTAKARRRSQEKPARTPPSAGKVSGPKMIDMVPKSVKSDKLSAEMEAFRMELEAEKQMVQNRNAAQLEESKKDLKNQLSEEEQNMRRAFETDKEFKRAEARKDISAQVAQEMESSRQAMRQRLQSVRDSQAQEIERAEEEEKRNLQAFVEAETRKVQEDMRSQSRDIDVKLERLRRESNTLKETVRISEDNERQSAAQAQADLVSELARIQTAKETLIREETVKERSRFESEAAAIQTSADIRIRDFQRNLSSVSSTDDLNAREAKLRQEAERTLKAQSQAVRVKFQEKLQDFKHECDLKLEEDRLKLQQDQTRTYLTRFEEERKIIDLDARQTLAAYQRTLTQQLESDKRRLSEEWRAKLEGLKGSFTDFTSSAEDLELDSQIRLLTQEFNQWQEIARKKKAQVEQLRTTHDAVARDSVRLQEDTRARRTQRPSSADSHNRVVRMEREVQELKRLVLEPQDAARPSTAAKLPYDPVYQWRLALQQEKTEIREFQKVIEQEKRAWMNDCANYRDRPTPERKAELQAVKKVLDQQITKLNDRVKELKLAENWIKKQEGGDLLSIDDDLEELKPDPLAVEPEDEVLNRWKQAPMEQAAPAAWYTPPLQPMATHKMQVYQRFLTREASKADQIQHLFSRQNMWINSMKEELSKIHFTPTSRMPRPSYYY